MAWCLVAPSHHLKQCWFIINKFLENTSHYPFVAVLLILIIWLYWKLFFWMSVSLSLLVSKLINLLSLLVPFRVEYVAWVLVILYGLMMCRGSTDWFTVMSVFLIPCHSVLRNMKYSNFCMLYCFKKTYVLTNFLTFLDIDMCRWLKSFHVKDKNLYILHS